ncbi:MAG: hypothetical protein LCH53_08275 [Bacteroidetes bacterium]|nr:hypothetical protein [Bacteroidota bacterium]
MSRLLPRRPLPSRRTAPLPRGLTPLRRLADSPPEEQTVVWTFPPHQTHRAPVLVEFLVSRKVDAASRLGFGEVWVPASQAAFGTLCARSFMRDYDRSLEDLLVERNRADGTVRRRWLLALLPLIVLVILGIDAYETWSNPYRHFSAEDGAILAVLVGGPVALIVLWRWMSRRA